MIAVDDVHFLEIWSLKPAWTEQYSLKVKLGEMGLKSGELITWGCPTPS